MQYVVLLDVYVFFINCSVHQECTPLSVYTSQQVFIIFSSHLEEAKVYLGMRPILNTGCLQEELSNQEFCQLFMCGEHLVKNTVLPLLKCCCQVMKFCTVLRL